MQANNFYVFKNVLSLLEAEFPNAKYDPRVRKGIWDGIIRFYKVNNSMARIPFGFVPLIKAYCIQNKINFVDENENEFIEGYDENDIDEFIKSLNLKFDIRDYQHEAIHKALKANNGLFRMATGSGKSLTQTVIMAYLHIRKNLKVVIVVPTVALVHQFYSDIDEYFENSPVKITDYLHKIYAGQEKHFDKGITITTWQSMKNTQDMFKDVDCIIVDEVQTAKNKDGILSNIMTDHSINAKYKFGFSGTIPREKVNKLNLIGNFGKINDIIDAKGLIDKGFGTPMEIICMFLDWPLDLREELPQDYNEEVNYLENSKTRNLFISKLAKTVTDKFGTTLVLFNTISHGEKIVEELLGGDEKFLPKLTKMKLEKLLDEFPNTTKVLVNIEPTEKQLKQANKVLELRGISSDGFFSTLEENGIFFVYGKVDGLEREEIRKRVELKHKSIIVASYATFSTGINITSLANLILASSTKSYERLIQSLGRTIRIHNKKDIVRVFDLIDDLRLPNYDNKLFKHFLERIEMYRSEGHKILEKIHKI
jgi:superfamily II DNA or RNA helicase